MGDRGDTVFDSAPHELYATIPEARREHTRYHADQIRDPEARTTESTLATCPSEGDESRGKLVGGKGRGRLECKNKMYEDHDVKVKEEYHHPTLTASTRKAYSESVGKEYREPQNSWVTCHCRFQYLLGAFFIIMAILLAVASLSLSLLLWFGVYGGSECSCPGDPLLLLTSPLSSALLLSFLFHLLTPFHISFQFHTNHYTFPP